MNGAIMKGLTMHSSKMKTSIVALVLLLASSMVTAQTLLLTIAYENGLHQLQSAKVLARSYPATVNETPKPGGIEFKLLDARQNVLYQGIIDPPGLLLQDHVIAHDYELDQTGLTQTDTVYTLRVPYQTNMADLTLLNVQVGDFESASSAHVATFDLRGYLPPAAP